jgi:hypothetical protein
MGIKLPRWNHQCPKINHLPIQNSKALPRPPIQITTNLKFIASTTHTHSLAERLRREVQDLRTSPIDHRHILFILWFRWEKEFSLRQLASRRGKKSFLLYSANRNYFKISYWHLPNKLVLA